MAGHGVAVDERNRIPLARDGEAHRLGNISRRVEIRRALLATSDEPFGEQLLADLEYLLHLHERSRSRDAGS